MYAWDGRFPEAKADLVSLARKYPDYADAWMALGNLYFWWERFRHSCADRSGADLHQPPVGLHHIRQPAADPGLPAAGFEYGYYFALVVGDLATVLLLMVVKAR